VCRRRLAAAAAGFPLRRRRTALTVVSRLPDPADGHPVLETVNGGYGLAGTRERLLLIDGPLHAGPDSGNWVVTAQVPQRR
jgi:hypothetical protein